MPLLSGGGGTAAQPANRPDRRSDEPIEARVHSANELIGVSICFRLLLWVLTESVPMHVMTYLMIESMFDEEA